MRAPKELKISALHKGMTFVDAKDMGVVMAQHILSEPYWGSIKRSVGSKNLP